MRTDDELIDAYLGGDDKAFSGIVERHRSRLLYVARKYANNEEDAQDILQDAFLKAATALGGYRRDAQLYTWLHKLVQNAGFDYVSHRANRELPSLDAGVYDLDRNPALAYEERTDLSLTLREALGQLREEQRVALCMTELAGYSLADVAELQGVRTGTIKSRRARAKEALREAIG